VFNILLQVLDDGRLTDGQGTVVDFRNTLIIMTSNLGAEALVNLPEEAEAEEARSFVLEAVRRHFKPEFLNRIDDLVLFKRLSRAQMGAITRIQLKGLEKLLRERDMSLSSDEEAIHYLAEQGFSPTYGARPLKRVIQKQVVDQVARKILSGEFNEGDLVHIYFAHDGLVIDKMVKPITELAV